MVIVVDYSNIIDTIENETKRIKADQVPSVKLTQEPDIVYRLSFAIIKHKIMVIIRHIPIIGKVLAKIYHRLQRKIKK